MPRASRQGSTRLPLPWMVGAGALALLLVAALFVPRGGDDRGAVRSSAAEEAAALMHATAGESAVTASAKAEIDRIVNQGLVASRALNARTTPAALVGTQVRCAEFEGQRYCLHTGWTDETQNEVVAGLAAEVNQLSARRAVGVANTGDVDALSTLKASAGMSAPVRAAAERAELTAAAKAVAKVWLLRHQIQGVPLPAGFLDRHPEVRTQLSPAESTTVPRAKATASASPSPAASSTPAPTAKPTRKVWKDYPESARILSTSRVAEQTRSYWCGPTSMQMIAWNWSGNERTQDYWASKLGTTSSGSAISEMVKVTNASTGWDQKAYAGPYVVLDIKSFSYPEWMLLNMRHLVDYKAPLIFHPILLKQYYPYLDDDASGHFQVGRGYDKRGKKPNLISYFEPWNQQRFDPSEPYISRVQWRNAYKSYRGNLAHFQHNIGV